MRLRVRVISRAKKNEVVKSGEGLRVRVTESPVDGKANRAVIRLLAKELGVRKGDIKIVQGEKSRDKVIEIRD